MDVEIIRDLFDQCTRSAEILGIDKNFSARLDEVRKRLPPMQIGKAGQLQEWLEDWDLQAPEPQHRHVSHLYGLFPGNQIGRKMTINAARGCHPRINDRFDLTVECIRRSRT